MIKYVKEKYPDYQKDYFLLAYLMANMVVEFDNLNTLL